MAMQEASKGATGQKAPRGAMSLFDYADNLTEINVAKDTTSTGGKSKIPNSDGDSRNAESAIPQASESGQPSGTNPVLQAVLASQQSQSKVLGEIGSALAIISSKLADGNRRREPSGSDCCADDSDSIQDGAAYDTEEETSDCDPMDALVNSCIEEGDNSCANDETNTDVASLIADLKDFFGDDDQIGSDILADLAKSIDDGLKKAPNMDKLKPIMDKYKRPKNTEFLLVPRVNPTIWNEARAYTRSRDLKMQQSQGLLVKATVPIIEMMDALMKAVLNKQQLEPNELLCKAKDSLRLLIGAHTDLNVKRRTNFKPDLQGPYKRLCTSSVETTTQLFGDELTKHIKDITESKELSKKMTTSSRGAYGGHRGNHGNRYKPYDAGHKTHTQKGYKGGKFGPSFERGRMQNSHTQGPSSFLFKRGSGAKSDPRRK